MDQAVVMQGFPPAPEQQVSLSNWRKPPFNRWAFQHVREIVPSAEIRNDPANVRGLASEPVDFSALTIAWEDESLRLSDFLSRTDTDSLVVLRNGKLAYEYYENGMNAATPHILMSVSKSVLGLIFGILSECGVIDLSAAVTDWLPELASTAYRGATIRNLLDMRAGVAFDENYLADAGPIIKYRKAQGWDPLDPGDKPSDLRRFCATMTDSDGAHSQRFHYVSPNTDILGWLIERASGKRYADLVSDLLWQPMGAERGAYITVDRLGAPRCAGGLCTTARDLARLGLLFAEAGNHDGRQIIPASWLQDIATQGDKDAWNSGDFIDYFPGVPMHYRSKWYVMRGDAPLIFGLGVFGQNIFVDPKSAVVIVKFSSHADPMDMQRINLTTAGILAMRAFLTG